MIHIKSDFILYQFPAVTACTSLPDKMKFMKQVKTINKISVKAGSAEAGLFKALASVGLKGKKLMVEPGLAVFHLPDGTVLEIYGPGSCYPDYLFAYGNIVISFKVDSLKDILTLLTTEGAHLLSSIEKVCDQFLYCHVLLKKDTVIGLYQDLGPGESDVFFNENICKDQQDD